MKIKNNEKFCYVLSNLDCDLDTRYLKIQSDFRRLPESYFPCTLNVQNKYIGAMLTGWVNNR